MSKRCPDCGQENGSWQSYCTKCGAELTGKNSGRAVPKKSGLRKTLDSLTKRVYLRTVV
ncbi:MAG: hypothetical protein IMW99_02445 [Firmicutes bacterium]|nr:hypothetical protein [Bacillota bacterium]